MDERRTSERSALSSTMLSRRTATRLLAGTALAGALTRPSGAGARSVSRQLFSFSELEIEPGDVIVIGDTPNDVEVARTGGTRVVCVTTGQYDRDALLEVGAEIVFHDFSDVDEVLAVLGKDGGRRREDEGTGRRSKV